MVWVSGRWEVGSVGGEERCRRVVVVLGYKGFRKGIVCGWVY